MPELADVIDVYSDVVPGPRQTTRGRRSTMHPLAPADHDFRTPALPTPIIERPAVWAEASLCRQDLLSRVEILEADVTPRERRRRLVGVGLVLDWLEAFPGDSWQQRWRAAGADDAGQRWMDTIDVPGRLPSEDGRGQLTGGVGRLILVGAVRPAYNWLYRFQSGKFFERFRSLRDPAGFARLDPVCQATERLTGSDRNLAYIQLSRMLAHNGGLLADITLADCVEAYRAQMGYSSRQHSHWYRLLLQGGILPADSPPSINAASRRGQLSAEELVDGYQVACAPIRKLLVDYLRERQAGMDYTSLRQLASKLVLLFWRDLELNEPGIDSIHLSDDVARRWKERLRHVRYGNHRLGSLREDPNAILMTVRAFSHLCSPVENGHWFWSKADTGSGGFRTLIPAESGQRSG